MSNPAYWRYHTPVGTFVIRSDEDDFGILFEDQGFDNYRTAQEAAEALAQGRTSAAGRETVVLGIPADLFLHADLPGVDPKDIELNMESGMLTLRGERKFETKEGLSARRTEVWHFLPPVCAARHR
jgi:HSP20 family molecular chaperone IbpA